MMVFPSGPFLRPHPVFWRVIFTLSTIYMLGLVWLLFHTPQEMRTILTYLDPNLGVPLPQKSYAEDCSLTYEAFSDKFDLFIIAHFCGWVVKAIVCRDRLLLWVISIVWEFIEITTAYFIPNFAECWWDQWILDVLLCNGLGIECGLYFLKLYETRDAEFQWVPFMSIDSLGKKFRRALSQITAPIHWERPVWEKSEMFIRFFYYNALIFLVSLFDMNLFTLKFW